MSKNKKPFKHPALKLGDERHETAVQWKKTGKGSKLSKDIRENRGTRQSKFGLYKTRRGKR